MLSTGNPRIFALALRWVVPLFTLPFAIGWYSFIFFFAGKVIQAPMGGFDIIPLLFLIPFVASAGSFISGIISDHMFGGRRAPVAAGIYCLEVITILIASRVEGAVAIAVAFVTVAFTANSTHSLLGPAAAMDIGGRKAAAFASGCINSFQYLGAGLAMQILGRLLDRTGYQYFFYFMVPWAIVGACLMFSMAGQKNLRKGGH